MEKLMYALEWYNLLFELPFLGAFIYLLFLVTGSAPDHDIHADIDTDIGMGTDHGIEHSVAHDGHDTGNESFLLRALGILGVGKIPLSLVFLSFCFLWGFLGWTANQLLGTLLPPWIFVLPSLAIAGIGSTLGTRYLALVLAKVMPSTETYGITSEELLGKRAEVRYEITPHSGTALVRDPAGFLREVDCRIKEGEEAIKSGEHVVLFEYNENFFFVQPDPLATT